MSCAPGGGAGGANIAFNAGLMSAKTMMRPSSDSATGAAVLLSRSTSHGCCHSGVLSAAGAGSVRKGALMTFTWSPRSLEKPMPCCTSAVSCSSSFSVSATEVVLPLASVTERWLTTTAAEEAFRLADGGA
ncbi:MAG: hypothetical protein U1F49_08595 [Rubrivivax sp.]